MKETLVEIFVGMRTRLVVSNSVALIQLFKANADSLLRISFEKVIISKKVYEEVVISGKEKGYGDAFCIEDAVGDHIEVGELDDVHTSYAYKLQLTGLGMGECETIALAKQLEIPAILDEKGARKAAEYSGIEYFGTLYLIYHATRDRSISSKEAKLIIQKLVANGFRISPELYIKFETLLEELK